MKITNPTKTSVFSLGLAALSFLAVPGGLQAQVQCVETNTIKYIQPPSTAGFDVSDSYIYMCADDFVCTNSGYITDIHLWGGWLNDIHGSVSNFWIGIYSNVPAIPGNSAPTNYSHPGILLWSNSFTAGQYSETPMGNDLDQFISHADFTSFGTESDLWYYCFEPNPAFYQTGSTMSPQIYWLGVFAEGETFLPTYNSTPQFGWQTTSVVQNDGSVNCFWPASGTLPGAGTTWYQNVNPPATVVDLAFKLETSTNYTPPPCCPEGNTLKYLQPPNVVNGFDVDGTDIRGGTLADDFPCFSTGLITDIHLWGSWRNDLMEPNASYTLSIWSDVPAVPPGPSGPGTPSHPGVVLWTQMFPPGGYSMCLYTNVPELFADPNPPAFPPFGASTNLYFLCFYPTAPFMQQGTATMPTNYWLSVTESNPGEGGQYYWGWKTASIHYNDAAVYTLNPTSPIWAPLTNVDGAPYDFSFQINTASNITPPVVCVESDGQKYVQGPNVLGGFDVWNNTNVLADDFVCTSAGPISDIHLWGSWLSDVPLTGTINFWLGIYTNKPANGSIPFSHPGTNLLWQQWFTPGQYAETVWTNNAEELFLEPGQSNVLGTDSVVWYYCFYPTNPFVQQGTAASPQTYWLAAYAQLPVGTSYDYGWKTTITVQNDISVHAPWPGSPPTTNPGWTPTAYQPASGGPAVPLDLAFKLTTCGPLAITYITPTNVVVSWSGGGYLQSATNVMGPYTDLPGPPTSPYTNWAATPPDVFYRLRCY